METVQIERPDGRLIVQSTGTGPLVLCLPGMGESTASYRHLTQPLADAGYSVALLDLRGHGDSATTFTAYGDEANADDVLAVIEALERGPAVILGNSMGAAVAVIAAARRPEAVQGLVLLGPFVRDHGSAAMRLAMRAALAKPWGPVVWRSYYRGLFGQQRPADHDAHTAHALDLLARPGRWPAFQATARTSHAPAEAALAQVTAPTLVLMGSKDKDFPDPEAEARWVADALRGRHVMIPGAGHYVMGEQPEVTLNAVLPFLAEVTRHG